MNQIKYKEILRLYISKQSSVSQFIDLFMLQWREDRDNNVKYDKQFQHTLDRIFTSCDWYSENPETGFEINENELREEITLLNAALFDKN